MGGSNLAQAPLVNFGLIQFSAIPGVKPLSCPYFVATRGGQEQFPGKRVTIFLLSDDAAILAALFYMRLLLEGGV